MKSGNTLVIIGNGMVGQEFLNLIADRDESESWTIIVYGEEPYFAYDRIALSSYFKTRSAESLSLVSEEFFTENEIAISLSDPVVQVDRKNKTVTSKRGFITQYDKLVFATGAGPFVPSIPGIEAEGVFVYRTIDDLKKIEDFSQSKNKGVVIGGGLLGLECVNALKNLDMEVEIVELSPHLMPAQLDPIGGQILKQKVEEKSFKVHTGKKTERIYENSAGKKVLQFVDGTQLDCDLIVVSAGIKPRTDLAKQCELSIGSKGGISINQNCQTNDEDIYAIGDCASYNDIVTGLVAPGYEMAQAVVSHIFDGHAEFKEKIYSTKLKLAGVEVATIGSPFDVSDDYTEVMFVNGLDGLYVKLNLDKNNNQLIGAIMVGDSSSYDLLRTHYENKISLPESIVNHVLSNAGGMASSLNIELPETATICTCKNITKSELIDTVNCNEVKNIEMLKSVSNAGTGCTGCVPTLKTIINEVCEKNGWGKNKAVCGHFDYSRQELFDFISVKGIRTFREVLDKYGHGDGCEICRPLIASILSTTHNSLITLADQMPAQDFNDRYLANIQRDGTYSIIPRIPGGEIPPKQLIKLAAIADKHGLYTRITGGQRISFFGARIHQLPDIWSDLVNNGFESGHAYGKALRTVKTCVGDTWCPWGVQDSTSLAIKIEERYKGLRSPHKTKIGVSGCIRDCAESKIKDLGIIATEGGWTLYVAGNGGRDVQIALVFAENLDDDTAIKYMDRLFMYYIKTANHLTRMGIWLNNIEGGIEHLKEIVINDSLNICQDLENDLNKLLTQAGCEWSSVLDRDDIKARFSHYVNSDREDQRIKHITARDQIQPVKFMRNPQQNGNQKFVESVLIRKWQYVTDMEKIVPDSGVCALVNDIDIALFKSHKNDILFAVENIDPFSNTSVLSRGILGDKNGEPMVISPISRKKFSLRTGQCLDDEYTKIRVFEVRENQGKVEIEI
jgi:nitrite reductase (NADH) large subunit